MAEKYEADAPVRIKYCHQEGIGLPDSITEGIWGKTFVIFKGKNSPMTMKRSEADSIIARSRMWSCFIEADKKFCGNPDAPKKRAEQGFVPGTFLGLVKLVDEK